MVTPVCVAVESNLSLLVRAERLSCMMPITEQNTKTTNVAARSRSSATTKGGRRGTRDARLMTKGGDTQHPSRRTVEGSDLPAADTTRARNASCNVDGSRY